MKSQFASSFQKKEGESFNRSFNNFLHKPLYTPELPAKKTSIHLDTNASSKTEPHIPSKMPSTNEKDHSPQRPNGCKLSEITSKPIKYHNIPPKQRMVSPNRQQASSPGQVRVGSSPTHEIRVEAFNSGVRSTLKNLLTHKAGKEGRMISPEGYRPIRTLAELPSHSPIKAIEKENQILRSENEMLKNELNQIKKHILFSNSSKKEDIISNLRDTIKKQDSQIKQLRIKLQLASKKNLSLASLIQTKDEELSYMSGKIQQLENELKDYKEKNGEKLEGLKQKINIIVQCYGELEEKVQMQEEEWNCFKEKWAEEKTVYLHRISFLEKYIANT